MAESVRDTVKRSIAQAKGEPDPDADAEDEEKERPPVGLVQNADGVDFKCGTCEYFDDGTCHNPDPDLDGRDVDEDWCCNHYDHEGMKTIVE